MMFVWLYVEKRVLGTENCLVEEIKSTLAAGVLYNLMCKVIACQILVDAIFFTLGPCIVDSGKELL